MILRALAWVLLFTFVSGPISMMTGELLHPPTDREDVCHAEGPCCPDPTDDGHPCGPFCACACCPGHALSLAQSPLSWKPELPPASELKIHATIDLHPRDVQHRVFRPPRA